MLTLTITIVSRFGLPDPHDNALEERGQLIESQFLLVIGVLETRHA